MGPEFKIFGIGFKRERHKCDDNRRVPGRIPISRRNTCRYPCVIIFTQQIDMAIHHFDENALHLFTCDSRVDVCGLTNLAGFLKSTPEYWNLTRWYNYVGRPDDPDFADINKSKSPYYHVEKIKSPVLIIHGYNDPRVNRKYVKEMVTALRKADKEVDFLEFIDEGHGIYRWRNKMIFYRKLEEFLARHLGGRCTGFEFSQWKS